MRKIILPAICSLLLWNCNESLPVNSGIGKSDSIGANSNAISGSIEIEDADLSILKTAHALAKGSELSVRGPQTQEVVAKYLAKALAASLSESAIREAIMAEVGKKFDGDFNVLWSRIKGLSINGGDFATRIRSKFGPAAQSLGIVELFNEFRRLQIAIPKNFEKWDGASPILVAFVPFTKDDLNTDFLYAYDSKLKEFKLDGKKAPDYPVVVISRNERTNNNEELIGGIFIDSGDGGLVQVNQQDQKNKPYSRNVGSSYIGNPKFGYPENKETTLAPMMNTAGFNPTPKVPLSWDKITVSEDLEGWFMGAMEVRMHLLSDKEVALTAQKNGVYEDNNYSVGLFLRNINEDIARYIGVKMTEIDDNDWDKNLNLKLSADVAKIIKGTDLNGNARGEIAYTFGSDTDDDYIGENNKIELSSQNSSTSWTAGIGKVRFKYDPGVVEYDISAMPYVSASTNQGRGNQWDVDGAAGASLPDGEDVAYRIIVPQDQTNTYRISTCNDVTNFDTMIQIFDKDLATPYMVDDDNSCGYNTFQSTMTAQLSGGTYYIVVDGWAGAYGSYKLTVDKI